MQDILSHLPAFVAVAELNSFSRAATQLGLSKSAISKRVTELESKLNCRLIHRTTRRLYLTEAGEQYYFYAARALQAAADGTDVLAELSSEPRGILRVNAPMAFARLHLAKLLPEFLNQYPRVEIDLTMSDQLIDLAEGNFDLGIRIGKLRDSSMVAHQLIPCKSVVCASPTYLQQYGEPTDLEQLSSHNCIFYSYFQAGRDWSFQHKGQTVRFTPKGNYRVNNSEMILEALLAGTGICQMPDFIVGPWLQQQKLQPILHDYQLPEHAIYAMVAQRKYQPAKVSAFIDFLKSSLITQSKLWS